MQVQRCEAKDGTVTYSNRECPAGTKPVRKVDTSPQISVPDQQAAKDRAKKDVAEVKQLEKDHKKQADEEKRAAEKREQAEAKVVDRCERARRDLARAIEARNQGGHPRGDDRADAESHPGSQQTRSGIAEGVSAIDARPYVSPATADTNSAGSRTASNAYISTSAP